MLTNVEHYGVSLLNNLLSDIQEVKLSDHLRIIRLDMITDVRGRSLLSQEAVSESTAISERVTQLLRSPQLIVEGLHVASFPSVHGYPIYYRVKEVSNHALEWVYVGEGADPFETSYERSKCTEAFSRVLLAIRLLENSGSVSRFPAIHHVNKGGQIKISEADYYYEREVPSNRLDTFTDLVPSALRITSGFENTIRNIFLAINNFSDVRIDIALSRFSRFWSRDEELDRLIDLVVAFEAIYLGKDENTELQFKVSARVARHIGENAQDRTNKFNAISSAYRIRSDILHGKIDREGCEKKCKRANLPSFSSLVSHLKDILAKGLRQLLLNETKETFQKDFHKKLDMKLIAGS